MAIGRALAAEAGIVDGAALADAGQHILQNAALRHVIQHVAGDDGRDARLACEIGDLLQADCVVGTALESKGNVSTVGEDLFEVLEFFWCGWGAEDGEEATCVRGQVVPVELAGALAGAALADGEQAAEARISRTVDGIGQDGCTVGEVQPAADDQAHASLLRALMCTDDAGERIAVGDAERGQAEHGGLREQFLDVGSTTQEGVIGGCLKLGIGDGHGGTKRSKKMEPQMHADARRYGDVCPVTANHPTAFSQPWEFMTDSDYICVYLRFPTACLFQAWLRSRT